MSGGIADGALSAVIPQGEPTPALSADESAPTPTPEPAGEPSPEPTGEAPSVPDKDDETGEGQDGVENDKSDHADASADNGTEHNSQPVPDNTGQPAPVPESTDAADYTAQLSLMQETLDMIIQQNEEHNTRLYYAGIACSFFLALILGVLLSGLFWRRILR